MRFHTMIVDGLPVTSIIGRSDIQIVSIDNKYRIRKRINGSWEYPLWSPSFSSIESTTRWLQSKDIGEDDGYIEQSDFEYIMDMFGFEKITSYRRGRDSYRCSIKDSSGRTVLRLRATRFFDGSVQLTIPDDLKKILGDFIDCPEKLIYDLDYIFDEYGEESISIAFCRKQYRDDVIECASNSRNLAKDLVRVKSSNVWGYNINIKNYGDKTGDVVVQFKDSNGGPGDIYMYFDVPIILYRKWHTAPSKGHFFWKNIRNNFMYRKLTGDKKGKLKNAIN